MNDWLTERVHASPDALALMIGHGRYTYAELDRLVNGVCARLVDAGVVPKQMVGVLLPNTLEYVCLIHAVARLGAVLVPLNTRLTPAELAWQIEHVGCKLVVTAPDLAEKLSIVNCELAIVNEGWLVSATLTIEHYPFTINHYQAVIFTSGTSGKPKGVPLTFGNHFYSAMASAYRLGTQPDDLWLSCLPLYHVGGLAVIWRSCLYGTAVDLHPRFILAEVNDALDSKPITMISLVPTMLHRLLETRTHWPESLRLALIGGAAATPDLVQKAQAASVPIATTYGLTEASSQVATLLPDGVKKKPGSVGRPLLFTSVHIMDENGNEQPPNEFGEIVVSGPTVMSGYFADLQAADSMHDARHTTIHTGDIGYLDDDGDLWIVQRRSDLIVTGGENVYPAEVESVLKAHTAVTDACVVGLPDAEWGQLVVALVVLNKGTAVTEDDLRQYCRQSLAGYKVPRRLHFANSLPQTASGKIARQQVAQTLADLD